MRKFNIINKNGFILDPNNKEVSIMSESYYDAWLIARSKAYLDLNYLGIICKNDSFAPFRFQTLTSKRYCSDHTCCKPEYCYGILDIRSEFPMVIRYNDIPAEFSCDIDIHYNVGGWMSLANCLKAMDYLIGKNLI